MEFQIVGAVNAGLTVNIYSGLRGQMVIELMGKGGRVTLPPDDAPKLMTLLSVAHEAATRRCAMTRGDEL